MQGALSSRENPLHDGIEFYVQCAIKFMHEHENFRRKPLKGNERGRKGRKGEGPAGYFVQGPPEFLSYTTGY